MSSPTDALAPGSLAKVIETVHRLRAPGGCPWDRAQTHQSLRQYLIEEAYEVLDVIDRIPTDDVVVSDAGVRSAFQEELGDLLMQVLLHSEMAAERGAFTIHDVARGLDEKLVRRHPHVFGEGEKAMSEGGGADGALASWEKQKAKEKAEQAADASVLDGVPKSLPALQKAARVIEKVTKVGFQWEDLKGPLDKIDEELRELRDEIAQVERAVAAEGKDGPSVAAAREKLAAELGDLLFTVANVGYLMKVSPEDALRGTLARFDRRFRHVEQRLREQGRTPDQSNLEEMDGFWKEAKKAEKVSEARTRVFAKPVRGQELKVYGLTGGAASGKSTAARFFAEAGIPVVDADQVSRELTAPGGKAHAAVTERFGTADRERLREIVFADPTRRKELEALLHPLIRAESARRMEALQAGGATLALYEAALLVDVGRAEDFDGLIVVEAPLEARIGRLMSRDGVTREAALRMIGAQVSDVVRRKAATWVLPNTGDTDRLRAEVRELVAKLKAGAGK